MSSYSRLLFILLILMLTPMATFGAVCTTTISPPTSIQATIDAASPGDVVCLSAGVYTEGDKIDIDKSITLQGPQFGVDPRPILGTARIPGGAGEAIIDGAGSVSSGNIVILASDVIIDGIQVRGNSGDLIDAETSTPTANTIIRYTIVNDSSGDEGIQLRTTANALIENNRVFETGGDGINVCCGSNGAVIQYNEVHDINSPDGAIYLYHDTNPPVQINATILSNVIYNVNNNDGIKVGSKDGDDALLNGGQILHNQVTTTAQDNITVYTSNVLVQGNQVTGSESENGSIYVSFEADGAAVDSNTILNNGTAGGDITYGVRVGKGALFPTNTTVNANCISGNEQGLLYVFPNAGPALDATNNWWGDASGPSGSGPGTGDSVSPNVTFSGFQTGGCLLEDPDDDRIFSIFDNCPNVFNERQEDTDTSTPEGDACEVIPLPVVVDVPVNNGLAMLFMILLLAGIGLLMMHRRQESV